jgi:predicted SAM-dependent methyltransferase
MDVHPGTHGTFDIIFMAHVLEHFLDPNEALQRCAVLLKDKGVLAVEVPNILKPFRSLDRYFLRYVHPSNFAPRTLQAMLEKHGFQLQLIDEGGHNWRVPQNLFVVSQKTGSTPCEARFQKEQPTNVLSILGQYRRHWRWRSAPLWYARSFALRCKGVVVKLGRPI